MDRLVKCIFSSSVHVQSGYLGGSREHDVPPPQHNIRKSLGRTYTIWPYTVLDHETGELQFERYQTGSLGQGGQEGIQKVNSLWKEAVFIVVS